MDTGYKSERPQLPRANANIFEILSFSWLVNLFKKGQKRDLDVNDLYSPLKEHVSSSLGNTLEKKWRLELIKAKTANRNPSLLRILLQIFGPEMMSYGFILSISEILIKLSQPLIISGLLAYFNPDRSKKTDLAHAYFYATALVLSLLATILIFHSCQIEMQHTGMKTRIACCSAIFRKALRLKKTTLDETAVGQIVNLLSNDVIRFDTAFIFVNFTWIYPLQGIIATYILWREIGISSVVGVAILLIFIPLQGWFGKRTSVIRLKTAIRTDERVRLMNEIVSGIQVIKMYTWEKPFSYLVQCARKMEIQQIRGKTFIRTIQLGLAEFQPRVALFFSIFAYVLLGNQITAQKIFIVIMYYGHLKFSVTSIFPLCIGQMAELLITIKRLQHFLLHDEKVDQYPYHSTVQKKETNGDGSNRGTITAINANGNHGFENGNSCSYKTNGGRNTDANPTNNAGIVVCNATAKWTDVQTENSLENINLIVRPGRLVAVVGPVGAGKSSLIQVILRELPLSGGGNVHVNGVVSYASQEPWLFAGSVQNNILFGLPMDEDRYEQVTSVCALKKDFQQLPYGDRTNVGERGVSLSGGQRARINLARALYKQADIYLLDDPLSAVDAQVGRHLYEKCIKGYLKEKTCVLVTHQVQYLTDVDQIVLMDNATILTEDTYEGLQKSAYDFANCLHSAEKMSSDSSDEINFVPNERDCDDIDRNSLVDRQGADDGPSCNGKNGDLKYHVDPIDVAETSSSGNVSGGVYLSYILGGGRMPKIIFFISVCVLTQVFASGGDLWIAYWINLEEYIFGNVGSRPMPYNSSNVIMGWSVSRNSCFLIFVGSIFMVVLMSAIRSVTLISVCTRASLTLHDKMFDAITRATMYFFNTNSTGRILNRFVKDMGAVDDLVPSNFGECILHGMNLLGTIAVVGISNVYLLIPSFVLAYIFFKITMFYLQTSRSIKRLEGVTRSPVFAHLNSALRGLTTIRAFEAEQMLSKEFDNHQDLHSSTCYLFLATSRALGLWIDLLCLVYMAIITFSFVVMDTGTLGGNIGLAITQAFALTGSLQWGIRQFAELENNMTSVERVLDYTNLPQEAALLSPKDKKPPEDWPTSGKITFENFSLRYGPDTPNVLKNLNINIEPKQKVGIVGRTGAGKSSLIGALFRLSFYDGSITIDDVEIHELGLHDLRSKISIIPQEPFLFAGTVRKNLDPFDEYPDHVLWKALDDVEIKRVFEDLSDGLNSKISESGSNFSIGQRQLLCLARAIVRNNKILVLDEATANIDAHTDVLIQNTIRDKFRDCTVLTIAHRLNTVMDSDMILVMDAGSVVEFDHPYNLLKNSDGYFYKMVEETGATEMLHNKAEESYLCAKKTD